MSDDFFRPENLTLLEMNIALACMIPFYIVGVLGVYRFVRERSFIKSLVALFLAYAYALLVTTMLKVYPNTCFGCLCVCFISPAVGLGLIHGEKPWPRWLALTVSFLVAAFSVWWASSIHFAWWKP